MGTGADLQGLLARIRQPLAQALGYEPGQFVTKPENGRADHFLKDLDK